MTASSEKAQVQRSPRMEIIMVKLLVGVKGTGKTKKLIELVGSALESSKGNVVVVEKGNKLIYDINYKARLVDTEQYAIEDAQSLYGFIAGLVAADHDLTDLFIDNTIKICNFDKDAFFKMLDEVAALAEKAGFNCVISSSLPAEELPSKYAHII